MALLKIIELDNGVSLSYHRISSISNETNIQTVINVSSYPSEAKREEEKSWVDSQKAKIEDENFSEPEPMNVYVSGGAFVVPYDESMNISKAYEYLKTLDVFSGSIDV